MLKVHLVAGLVTMQCMGDSDEASEVDSQTPSLSYVGCRLRNVLRQRFIYSISVFHQQAGSHDGGFFVRLVTCSRFTKTPNEGTNFKFLRL